MSKLTSLTSFLALLAALSSPARADIVWTGAVSDDIFDEANWDLSGSTVTVVDPNVTIDDDVRITNAAAPVVIPNIGGQVRFQIGDGYALILDNSVLDAANNDGVGGEPGTSTGPDVLVVNGGSFNPFFISNKTSLDITSGCSATFGGGAVPINGSTINLTANATLAFTDETVQDYINEHLGKTTVDGAPAVVDGNIRVESDGGVGSIITVLSWVGTNYCGPASLNSTGSSGVISGWGRSAVTANDLALTAGALPLNEVGYFVCSQTQDFVSGPGGSQGNLCLGGKIGRFVGQVQNTGNDGEFTIQVDLASLPVWRNQPALAGETWYFQAWFNDGATSNFTDGLSVTFL